MPTRCSWCALFVEIHMNYAALVGGGAPIQLPEAGSYDDYCVRQHEYTSALTLESPEVRRMDRVPAAQRRYAADIPTAAR